MSNSGWPRPAGRGARKRHHHPGGRKRRGPGHVVCDRLPRTGVPAARPARRPGGDATGKGAGFPAGSRGLTVAVGARSGREARRTRHRHHEAGLTVAQQRPKTEAQPSSVPGAGRDGSFYSGPVASPWRRSCWKEGRPLGRDLRFSVQPDFLFARFRTAKPECRPHSGDRAEPAGREGSPTWAIDP